MTKGNDGNKPVTITPAMVAFCLAGILIGAFGGLILAVIIFAVLHWINLAPHGMQGYHIFPNVLFGAFIGGRYLPRWQPGRLVRFINRHFRKMVGTAAIWLVIVTVAATLVMPGYKWDWGIYWAWLLLPLAAAAIITPIAVWAFARQTGEDHDRRDHH